MAILSTVWKEAHAYSPNGVHLIWQYIYIYIYICDSPNRQIKATAKYTMCTVYSEIYLLESFITRNRAAAWTRYNQIFPVYVLSKFMNFQVARMYGNNGTYCGDTKCRKFLPLPYKQSKVLPPGSTTASR